MNTVTSNRMVDNFLKYMRNWETDSKIELINKLKESIKVEPKANSDFSSCFGLWNDTRSPEEIVAEIRADRVNQEDIEGF